MRLALLYKVVKGQVAVSADSLGLVKADNRIHINLSLYLQIALNIRTLLYLKPSLSGINFLVIQYLLRVWLLSSQDQVAKHLD